MKGSKNMSYDAINLTTPDIKVTSRAVPHDCWAARRPGACSCGAPWSSIARYDLAISAVVGSSPDRPRQVQHPATMQALSTDHCNATPIHHSVAAPTDRRLGLGEGERVHIQSYTHIWRTQRRSKKGLAILGGASEHSMVDRVASYCT